MSPLLSYDLNPCKKHIPPQPLLSYDLNPWARSIYPLTTRTHAYNIFKPMHISSNLILVRLEPMHKGHTPSYDSNPYAQAISIYLPITRTHMQKPQVWMDAQLFKLPTLSIFILCKLLMYIFFGETSCIIATNVCTLYITLPELHVIAVIIPPKWLYF